MTRCLGGRGLCAVIAGVTVGIVFAINTINGLHELQPAVPEIKTAAHRLRHQTLDHPFNAMGLTFVAFAVSSSWNMNLLWMPLFLAWVAKFVTFRYGGPSMYRKCLPFFCGLLLGDFASTAIWNGLCIAFGWPGHRLFY